MPLSILLPFLVFVAVGLIILVALAYQNLNLMITLVAVPLVALFFARPDLWLIVLIAISNSALKFPQAPANLNAFHVFSFLFVVFIPFRKILEPACHRQSPVRKYVWLFSAILVLTMAVRGIGIKALGSSLWGGAPYVVLLTSGAFFLSADAVVLSSKQWKWALLLMCLLSTIPAAAEGLFTITGGRVYQQYYFVQPRGFILATLDAVESESGIARFNLQVGTLLAYVPFLLFEKPFSRHYSFMSVGIVLVSLFVTMLSGFRSWTIMVILFVIIASTMTASGIQWRRTLLWGLFFIVVLGLSLAFASHLPASVQRALSFLPSSSIDWQYRANAESTTIWRLDVWHRAIELIPQYWMVGQGFAFYPRELLELYATGSYDRDWALVTRSYHNGPLSLLLVLGLPGLLVGFGFLVAALREYFRLYHETWMDPLLNRIFRLMLAQFSTQFVLFITLYGDTQISFPNFFFQALILEGVARAREAGVQAASGSTDPTSS